MIFRSILTSYILICLADGLYMQYLRGQPRCYYGERGSLTATCENASASYFRTTGYRFDNLDETVRCIDCNLGAVPGSAFDISGNHILNLDLKKSRISSLAPSSFVGLVYMETLNLAENHIMSIVPSTFKGIKKLQWLNIGYNEITVLINDAFAELGNLTTLYLNDNAIKTAEVNSFNKLTNLVELYLQNNFLTSLDNIFLGLHSIKIINMQNNSLVLLKPENINSTNLLDLDLSRNKLKSLEEGSVSTPKLEVLNISYNEIEIIKTGAFKGSKALHSIDLEGNSIKELNQNAFSRLYSLRQINLAYNKMTILQTSVFTHIPELRYLNVSHNQIKSLQRNGVLPLYYLHSLDLSYNNLTYLDYKVLFEHAPRLVLINLENNSLPCYLVEDMMEFFKEDAIDFSIDDKYGEINKTCNATGLMKPEEIIPDDAESAKFRATTEESQSSSPNVYVIYSFIFILIGLVVVLFFLQYKTYLHLRYGNQGDIAEVGLMSSRGLESRDAEY